MERSPVFKKITSRNMFLIVSLTLASVLIISVFCYLQRTADLKKREFVRLSALRDIKVQAVNSWLSTVMADMQTIANINEIKNAGTAMCRGQRPRSAEIKVMNQVFSNYLNNHDLFLEFFIVSFNNGKIVYSTNADNKGGIRENTPYVNEAVKIGDMYVKDIYFSRNLKVPTMTFAIRLYESYDSHSKPAGVLVGRVYLERTLYKILSDSNGLGSTGETVIVNSNMIALNRLRGYDGMPLTLKIKSDAAILSSRGKSGLMEMTDYRGEKVLAAYTGIPVLGWGLITKQDRDELYRPINGFLIELIIFMIIFCSAAVWAALHISRQSTGAISEIIGISNRLIRGDSSARVTGRRNDEFRYLARSFNALIDTLLSNLSIRRKSLEVIEIMVSIINMKEFSELVLGKLVEITDSSMGAFYVLSKDGREFNHLTSIGMSRDTMENFQAGRLEGMFGKALATREITVTGNLSEKTLIKLRTIIGDAIPQELITIPVIVNNMSVAIITIARMTAYSDETVKMLEQIRPVLNTAYSNIAAIEETRRLAEELGEKNRLLELQKEDLESQASQLIKQADMVKKQNIELECQRLKVEDANRLKSEFLSNMSHELRTPLNSMLALSRVLLVQTSSRISEEEAGYIEIIDRNGKKLLALINDILDLSKIEAGRIDLKPGKINLFSTISIITDNLEQLAGDKGIELILDVESGFPLIESDESRIYQIFQNIIGNAIKFTEKGHVRISGHYDTGRVVVTVEDTGIGIDEDDLPHIFEEFRQIDGTLSRKYEGTGLGLAIAQKSAQLISGSINVKSTPGRGSLFSVTLPILWQRITSQDKSGPDNHNMPDAGLRVNDGGTDLPGSPAAGAEHRDNNPGESGNGAERILIVDDDRDNIITLRAILKERYRLIDSSHGIYGLELALNEQPDLILLDMALPGISGFTFVDRIKSDARASGIPIIAVTAMTMKGDRERILKAGCDDYLAKPFNIDELINKIEYWLRVEND